MNIGDKVRTYVEGFQGRNIYNGTGVIVKIKHEGYYIRQVTPLESEIKLYKRDMIQKIEFKQDNYL